MTRALHSLLATDEPHVMDHRYQREWLSTKKF